MTGEIINRVGNSNLITIDLSDYSPKRNIAEIDIKDWNVQVIKEDQPTRFYYKVSYVNLE